MQNGYHHLLRIHNTHAALRRCWALSRGSNHHNSSMIRTFSSTSTTTNTNHRRVVLALYRNLLQWCRETDAQAPLSNTLPPLQLQAPQHVPAYTLEVLLSSSLSSNTTSDTDDNSKEEKALQFAREHLMPCVIHHSTPSNTNLQRQQSGGGAYQPHMTVSFDTAEQVSSAVRALFRLNQTTKDEYRKEKIQLGFEALQGLNQLSDTTLNAWKQARHEHFDRRGVEFKVGQVVQHLHERWRGVVVGWSTTGSQDDSTTTATATNNPTSGDTNPEGNKNRGGRLTSLTTKPYTPPPVSYDILVDMGDGAQQPQQPMGRKAHGTTVVGHDQLSRVQDAQLQHIRHPQWPEYFEYWHESQQQFVSTPLWRYQYPLDGGDSDTIGQQQPERDLPPAVQTVAIEMVDSVQAMALELLEIITDAQKKKNETKNDLLESIQARLRALSQGKLMSPQKQQQKSTFPLTLAALHLHDFLLLQLELLDLCYHRFTILNTAPEKSKPRFHVGQVVRHTHFDYRGVIVGWDPKPVVDVSRWDGVQHIPPETLQNMPFYHVIPDPYDCLRAFGGDRGLRYVCQENLEDIATTTTAGDHASTNIDVELEDWEWTVDSKGVRTYQPPASVLYKYAQEQDGKETEHCINQLLETINTWQYQACTETVPDDSVAASWTMENFLLLLRHADSLEDATSIQELIKEIRKAHSRLELRWKLERGIAKLMAGEATQALEIFESVVEDDPNFTEGWNKLATCEFMLGKYDESEVWTHKTLELDPNHFQSMNGLGLIYFQKNEYQKAVDCFRKSLDLDPWSPVASKLSAALDLLAQKDKIPADDSST